MTKEEFNTKYKDRFRINDVDDLEKLQKCQCEHCQECQYSYPKEWLTLMEWPKLMEETDDDKKELELLHNYVLTVIGRKW